jgi:hypothetical protein
VQYSFNASFITWLVSLRARVPSFFFFPLFVPCRHLMPRVTSVRSVETDACGFHRMGLVQDCHHRRRFATTGLGTE